MPVVKSGALRCRSTDPENDKAFNFGPVITPRVPYSSGSLSDAW